MIEIEDSVSLAARRKTIFRDTPRTQLKIDLEKKTPPEITRQTDKWWGQFLESKWFKNSKLKQKRIVLDQIYMAAGLAFRNGAVVQAGRNNSGFANKDIIKNMIAFCDDIGMFKLEISAPCNPSVVKLHESRLVPKAQFFEQAQTTIAIQQIAVSRPPIKKREWIEIRTKDVSGEKINLPVPMTPLVKKRIEILKAMDLSWRLHKIWFKPVIDSEQKTLGQYEQLAAQPFCVFTNDLEHGGRIYTEGGITTIAKESRHAILIERAGKKSKSVEVDIKNQHLFLCYALKGVNYQDDGYKLLTDEEMDLLGWDVPTKSAFRKLVKICFNAILNAKDRTAAIAACNNKLNTKGKATGKALAKAKQLQKWIRLCGVSFAEIYDLVRTKHPALSDLFDDGTSTGLKLQRLDSDITLKICFHFARQNKICLPIHDSYVVAVEHKAELIAAIKKFYKAAVGFSPRVEVKRALQTTKNSAFYNNSLSLNTNKPNLIQQ